jgi:hypothetical protein
VEKVKQGIDDNEQVSIQMRQLDPEKAPWVLMLRMRHMQTECVNMIVRLLKEDGFLQQKSFEQKRKILESEVTSAQYAGIEIEKLLETIQEWETKLSVDR